jgi:16S rRNA (cytidine1402-2'-O)-methyltransferase
MVSPGRLYIVATPIGNARDITLRALDILRSADAIICEEWRQGSTLLKKLDIPDKELITLNEHNEQVQVPGIVSRILTENLSLALISDCGTPVFADPGHALIRHASEYNITITPIPGASSLMAALSLLDFKLEKFIFGGFLPRNSESRRKELHHLRKQNMPIILMDTPYRMPKVLENVATHFGKNAQITLACDLSLRSETIYRGTIGEISKQAGKRKAEFILIIH